jgi:hypothetical protein
VFNLIKDDYSAKVSDKFNSLIKEIKDVNNLHTDKLALIDISFKKFLGLSSAIINSMSDNDVLTLMKKNDKLDGNYCLIAAALLYEEALIFDKDDRCNQSYSKYEKAFTLIFNMKSSNAECEIVGYENILSNVSSAMENFHLPLDIKKNLITYYELNGEYSKAEDSLYDLLEDSTTHSFAKERLKEFYSNLLLKDDLALEKGDLPRSEILEAIESL